MRAAWAVAGMLVLAACSAAPAPEPAPPPVAAAPPGPPPPPDIQVKDACGASEYQHLVGRPRTEVPVPVRPELQRVACLTCPVTMDYNPRRLNFYFDAATGIIKEVRCG